MNRVDRQMFEGKTVMITGAGSGIGRETARLFATLGANTILVGRRVELCEETAEQLFTLSASRHIAVKADISQSDDVQAVFTTAMQEFGGLNAAFFNAEVGFGGSILDQPLEEFEQQFKVNCTGLWLCLKHAIKAMKVNGGSIVTNLSVHSKRTIFQNTSAYTASKHAAMALTKAAAVEAAAWNIRVNGVAPGPIMTDMLIASSDVIGGVEGWSEKIPMKRVGQTSELAEAVVWLAGDKATFVNGAILNVDGGFLAA